MITLWDNSNNYSYGTEIYSPTAPEAPEELPNDAAPTEVETELPPVETQAALSLSEEQTDKLIEEAAALVTGTTTTTAPTCHSQRIENDKRTGIVAPVHECEWNKYENRDDIQINGKEFNLTICINIMLISVDDINEP